MIDTLLEYNMGATECTKTNLFIRPFTLFPHTKLKTFYIRPLFPKLPFTQIPPNLSHYIPPHPSSTPLPKSSFNNLPLSPMLGNPNNPPATTVGPVTSWMVFYNNLPNIVKGVRQPPTHTLPKRPSWALDCWTSRECRNYKGEKAWEKYAHLRPYKSARHQFAYF